MQRGSGLAAWPKHSAAFGFAKRGDDSALPLWPCGRMEIMLLTPASFTRSPWKNGGGVTIDIAEARREGSAPGSWDGLIWRLGRTSITQPGPFSDLAGYDRLQAVTGGSGLTLETPGGIVDLTRPFSVARYPGEAPITSRLSDGPVEVVNLIGDRQLASISLDVLAAGEAMAAPPGIVVILAADGAATVAINGADHAIDPDHALKLLGAAGAKLACRHGRVLVAGAARKG